MLAALGITPDVVVRFVILIEVGKSGFATPLQFTSTKLVIVYTSVSPGSKVFTVKVQLALPIPVTVCKLLNVNVHGPLAVTAPLKIGLTLLQTGLVPAVYTNVDFGLGYIVTGAVELSKQPLTPVNLYFTV